MSLSDILKGASLPKLHSVVEDEATKTKATKSSATLDAAQQSFLADLRGSITQKIQEHRAHSERIKKEIKLLLNRPQRVSWQGLWALVNELSKFDFTPPSVIVFGGWHRKADCPKPADSNLQADVKALLIFGEMLRRIDVFFKASPEGEVAARDAVWSWKNENKWAFANSHSHTIGELREYSQCCAGGITQEIHAHFLYAQENALIFYPSPCDLHAGWKEFLDFADGFNYLPASVLKSLGPFFLIMQEPVKK